MMGYQPKSQMKLFYYNVNIEERIPKNHILRLIKEKIDFKFIYGQVKDKYGYNGNESVPPPVILKMMLLLMLYNVRSERELMATIPLRMDWLWFLDYDIDSKLPDHSVLSKARRRWGVDAFREFFERVVWQCVEAGLISGEKLFVDSSLIDADASNNSVVSRQNFKRNLGKKVKLLESRLEETEQEDDGKVNSRYISTTDPDASVTRRGNGKSKLRYKTHRTVDARNEIITGTKMTAGSTDDAHVLNDMIEIHEENTKKNAEVVIGDSKYGTIDNYLLCKELGKKAHIRSLEETQKGTGRRRDIFPKEEFIYNPDDDTFTCPSGETLRRRKYYKSREHYEYKASKGSCGNCKLKGQCTNAKNGRTLKRHIRQEDIDEMLDSSKTKEARKDLKYRQHLSERSFAQSVRYGYKRARWRRLWRVQIQDYLIAALQNIIIIVRNSSEGLREIAVKGLNELGKFYSCNIFLLLYCFKHLICLIYLMFCRYYFTSSIGRSDFQLVEK